MAEAGWDEQERNRAIRIFKKVHPDWHVVTGQTQCPKCKTFHYCQQHRWVSRNWLGGIGAAMLLASDPALREWVRKEGLMPPTGG